MSNVVTENMSWLTQKASFQQRIDTLAQQNINGKLSELNQLVATYVQTAGLSQDSTANPTYTAIQQKIQEITEYKNMYTTLHSDITSFLRQNANDLNLGGTLEQNGQLQKDIKQYEKTNKDVTNDVETARARDELLRSKKTETNAHTLFVMDRPLKKGMIPVLWAISILFIGVALVIIRMQLNDLPSISVSLDSIAAIAAEYLGNPVILLALLGASIIAIIFLSLRLARVI